MKSKNLQYLKDYWQISIYLIVKILHIIVRHIFLYATIYGVQEYMRHHRGLKLTKLDFAHLILISLQRAAS